MNLLQLASNANEVVIRLRDEMDTSASSLSYNPQRIVSLAATLAVAVDALTGAIVEEANR